MSLVLLQDMSCLAQAHESLNEALPLGRIDCHVSTRVFHTFDACETLLTARLLSAWA